jgi:hypothetical protein
VACGGSPSDESDADVIVIDDAASKVDSSAIIDAAAKKDAAVQECATSCVSDEDCQTTCPSVANSVSCCDTSTETCYAYASLQCPAAVTDAGFD